MSFVGGSSSCLGEFELEAVVGGMLKIERTVVLSVPTDPPSPLDAEPGLPIKPAGAKPEVPVSPVPETGPEPMLLPMPRSR